MFWKKRILLHDSNYHMCVCEYMYVYDIYLIHYTCVMYDIYIYMFVCYILYISLSVTDM